MYASFKPKETPRNSSDMYARFWPKVGIMEVRILSITALGRAGPGE